MRRAKVVADKAYDSQDLRAVLKWLGVEPEIPLQRDDYRGLGLIR